MIKDIDNSFLLREANGIITKFFPLDGTPLAGKMAQITNRCGNFLIFQYDPQGRISTVLDSLSRAIVYEYSPEGRLSKIRDFANREIVFSYSSVGDLIAIRCPIVTAAPNVNDFPNGKVWHFTYSQGFTDEKLNHNLLSVTMPNETAVNGSAYLVNSYNSDDRLISQVWGGTNVSAIAAGGTISYARQIVNQAVEPSNPDLAREVVMVIDRNSNETVFHFNNSGHLIRKEEKTRGIRSGRDPASFMTLYSYTNNGLLRETILPQQNRVVYEYDENNNDVFQQGNLLSVTHFPDALRLGDQQFLKITYQYEPVFNRVLHITEQRGNDSSFQPQNGGSSSDPGRYLTEFFPDYFEGNLDTVGCACGFTLRQLVDKFGIDISSVANRLGLGDLNNDGRFQICGNSVLISYPQVNLRVDSPQATIEGGVTQLIETRISFNEFGQIASAESPEGEIAEYVYYPEADPEGDGANVRPGNNAQGRPFNANTGGFVKKSISDHSHSSRYHNTALPTQTSNEFRYDVLGNVISQLNGRNIRTDYLVNALNQIVEIRRATDVSLASESGLTTFGYKMRIYYDHNNNVVKTEADYRDGNNPNLPQFIARTYVYDILNKVVETTQTVSTSETITTQLRYDANQNLIEVRSPMAVAGSQPGCIKQVLYDERDLIFQSIGAHGTLDEQRLTYHYDFNANLIEMADAEDNNGDGLGDVTTYQYDGFDRMRNTISAVGDEIQVKYDPSNNIIERSYLGTIGGASRTSNITTGNELLAKATFFYDELARVFRSDEYLFVANGIATNRPAALNDTDSIPGDGKVTKFFDYDRNSRTTFVTAASPLGALQITRKEFDGMSRTIRLVDAENNEALTEYDKNSNPIRLTTIARNPSGRIPQESFTTLAVYDSLDRAVRITDNLGHTRRMSHDSRDMVIRTSDAQGAGIPDPLGLFAESINDNGNITHIVHDGLARTLQTIRELATSGQGGNPLDLSNPNNPDGKIIETNVWDKNSRLVSVSDDKSNTTSYQYDNLNRGTLTTFADGTTHNFVFDRDNNVTEFRDNNGTVVTNSFDAIHRLARKAIARSTIANVVGTTLQEFQYDGLSRLTLATDNNDPNNFDDDSIVARKYDSLSRLLEEVQNGKVVSTNWREEADIADCTYPNGRQIAYSYDKLDRIKTIANAPVSTPIASYDYIGHRLLERVYQNGTKLTMLNDSGNADVGYDALPRLVQMRHLGSSNSLIAGYLYRYNRENVKTSQESQHLPQLSELYNYDSSYRVTNFQRGTLNATKDALTDTAVSSQSWQLDGVSSWANTVVDGVTKTQTVNAMNEYTSFAGITQSHDKNGNLTQGSNLGIGSNPGNAPTTNDNVLLLYDFANRLTEVRKQQDNSLIASYQYDAFNRRISKQFNRNKEIEQGEYLTDSNTIALYHFNETSGLVMDSSGNNNHGTAPKKIIRGIEGLFDTNAVQFTEQAIKVANSQSLNNIQDELTVETWVYLSTANCTDKKHEKSWKDDKDKNDKDKDNHQGWHNGKDKDSKSKKNCGECAKKYKGKLIHRPGSYQLKLRSKERKAEFSIYVRTPSKQGCDKDDDEEGEDDDEDDEDKNADKDCQKEHLHTRKISIKNDTPIPTDQWVHLAAVYNGAKVTLFVDSETQSQEKPISGNVRVVNSPLFLGGSNFRGKLEETRISNTVRTTFGKQTITITENVLRSFFYDGWRIVEERERFALVGEALGPELVTRQFVDGAGLDEHLTQDVYNETGSTIASTLFYHANERGDTVALTDRDGGLSLRLEYSPYGNVYSVNTQNQLEPLGQGLGNDNAVASGNTADLVAYTFQGRQVDTETGLYYFRNRYYSPEQGRFLQRDMLGYQDGLNLHEFAGSSPLSFNDPIGLTAEDDVFCFAQELEQRNKVAQQLPSIIWNDLALPVASVVNFSVNLMLPIQEIAGVYNDIREQRYMNVTLGSAFVGMTLLNPLRFINRGFDIALGLKHGNQLEEFAKKTGSLYYEQWRSAGITQYSRDQFEKMFIDAANQAPKIHFNLTGMSEVKDKDFPLLLKRGKEGYRTIHNYTRAEFHQIATNPDWLDKTQFHYGGKVLKQDEMKNVINLALKYVD